MGQKSRLRAGVDVFTECDQHLVEHGDVRLLGRPAGEKVQSRTSERVLVAVVEQMNKAEHLGTEQSAGRVRART